MFVFDDEHIAFWDRSLGTSSTNLEINPHVCMLYYDSAARTGWRFYGTATILKDGDLRQQIMKRVVKGEIDKGSRTQRLWRARPHRQDPRLQRLQHRSRT